MKKFLSKLFLFFILPWLILAYPIDYFLSYQLKKSNRYYGEIEVWKDIYEDQINADIAVYGSSRAWVHFNTQIMEDSLSQSVYNFGLDGHNFALQYLRHIEYFKYNSHPEQIILSVDLFSFQRGENLYLLEQFLPFMLWNNDIKRYTASYAGFQDIDYYLPVVRFQGKYPVIFEALKNAFIPPQQKYRHKGYAGQMSSWNSDLEEAMKRQKHFEVNIDPLILSLFERFIDECNKMNIKVILVYTPEYIAGREFVTNRSAIIDICKQIADKNGLLFLDYSNDEICKDKDLFYNSIHLNSKGSDIFTKKLMTDLKNKY